VDELYVVGLALDYCVGNTALDAKEAGLKVTVIKECTRGVAAESSYKMVKRFEAEGVDLKSVNEIF
jgi:nicotinamidase-related amidase